MNFRSIISIMAITWGAAGCALQEFRPHSNAMVIESPAELPALAQNGAADLFLHYTPHGKVYLYIETDGGQRMSILDVTEPAAIHAVANVPVATSAPFHFVQDINTVDTLVRYSGDHGLAVLNFSTFDRPSISQSSELAAAGSAQSSGNFGLLLTPPYAPVTQGVAVPAPLAAANFKIMDTSQAGPPVLMGSILGVKQQLTKLDTDTVFLLADNGVTVVRDLRAEEALARHVAVEMQ